MDLKMRGGVNVVVATLDILIEQGVISSPPSPDDIHHPQWPHD